MIRIDNLTVRYGALVAADRITLAVERGDIFGLVGPNGAGKTTTLKVLAGLLLPDGGRVTVDGLDVVKDRERVRMRLGYMADFFGVYDYLTVTEYLEFFGGMYGVHPDSMGERIRTVLAQVSLSGKQDAFVRYLSRGMKQRLYFARALVHDPDLLVLDEPASGMDPRGRAEMVTILKDLNRDGKTVMISSHILDELQDLCTVVGIMETGKLVAVRSLRQDATAAAATRHVLVKVFPADAERAREWFKTRADMRCIRETPEGFVLQVPNNDDAVAALMSVMVGAELRILPPVIDNDDLKSIFLQLTRGELM